MTANGDGKQLVIRNAQLGAVGLTGALAVGGLFGLSKPAQAATCETSGQTRTCTYTDPSAAETLVVPPNVTSAQITLRGGSGGHGAKPPLNPNVAGGAGGGGGITGATVALTPGTTLRIYVGGAGGDGRTSSDACTTGNQGGAGGLSGGIQTGGNGGNGFFQDDMGCSGGGGGGGSFVMSGGRTLGQITFGPGGAVPLLVAGGGGGGGGGSQQLAGAGGNGGSSSGATAGAPPQTPQAGSGGGAPGASGSVTGGPGVQAVATESLTADDAGGGGGGGYAGGGGGGLSSGGGGGAGLGPANGVGPAGSAGSVTITFSATDTAKCSDDGDNCVAEPPAGEETRFKIVAFGGNENATLFGVLNGGVPPTCRSRARALSPDWVQFGFTDPKDGRTWSKRIRVTGTEPTSKATAQRILAETQICFAAPYKFVVKRGENLIRVGKHWEGLLAHCRSGIVAEAKAEQPELARPCVLNRSLVEKSGGWVVRVNYFVPNGELDPQGRSAAKEEAALAE